MKEFSESSNLHPENKNDTKGIIINALGQECIVKEVMDGYEIAFFNQEDADDAVFRFWIERSPETERNFKGMWKPTQTLSHGARTEPRILSNEEINMGLKAKVFFGGNVQAMDEKTRRTLHILGYFKKPDQQN